ncbi:MAG: hypothetical protein HY303_18370 [Candidatus Wallbacteria bacterium]|nr:hypothetical protein [Candidatus Wallbacteria bacterium]
MRASLLAAAALLAVAVLSPLAASDGAPAVPAVSAPLTTTGELAKLEKANPLRPLPKLMLGHDQALGDFKRPPDVRRARLGRWLFFDPRLSPGTKNSCEKCHSSARAWSENTVLDMHIGPHTVPRRTMTFTNTAFSFFPEQFWDGRSPSLDEQPKGPKLNVAGIAAIEGYKPFFIESFGDSAITSNRICQALADWERMKISGDSPWDRWRRKGDSKAVSEEVKLGDKVFFGRGRCAHCHVSTVLTDPKYDLVRTQMKDSPLHLVGNSFTDWRFHNEGVGFDTQKRTFRDPGRSIATGRREDTGAFKTPPLRDVALHPPYMHDGSLPTLQAVVEHYRKGGIDNPYLDSLMEPLELTDAEAKALVAFLEALNGTGYEDHAPEWFPE